MAHNVRGTMGYAAEADDLFIRYESYAFEATHGALHAFIPASPGYVLDVGAGTGRDAAWYAEAGYTVVAVEPSDEMRRRAMALHSAAQIEWIDDSLPALEGLKGRTGQFDLIQLSAVWMHLDKDERAIAMPKLARLLKPGGILLNLVRRGPAPPGRCMFDVPQEETVALAATAELVCLHCEERDSAGEMNRKAGVTWMNYAFKKR